MKQIYCKRGRYFLSISFILLNIDQWIWVMHICPPCFFPVIFVNTFLWKSLFFCRFSNFFHIMEGIRYEKYFFLWKFLFFVGFQFFSYYGGNSLRVRKVFRGCCRTSFSSAFAFLRCFYKTVSSDCPIYTFGGICFGCFTSSVPTLKRLQMQTNL